MEISVAAGVDVRLGVSSGISTAVADGKGLSTNRVAVGEISEAVGTTSVREEGSGAGPIEQAAR